LLCFGENAFSVQEEKQKSRSSDRLFFALRLFASIDHGQTRRAALIDVELRSAAQTKRLAHTGQSPSARFPGYTAAAGCSA
jgi:hypothetical protein